MIARALAELVPHVRRGIEAGGEDCHLAPLGQDVVCDRQLAAGGVADFRHLGQLSFVAGELLSDDALVDLDPAQRFTALGMQDRLGPLFGFLAGAYLAQRARSRGGLPLNPTRDLELPAPRPREVEIVSVEVATGLLDAVPADDRPLWATALYAGLRHGELRALRWGVVDLVRGTIHVRESWDPKEGAISPKTRTSQRATPIPGVLRDLLLDPRMRRGEPPDDVLVFDIGDQPFHAASLYRRADAAWRVACLPNHLRLHQARHTYASFMIAAGVNAKALSVFMGHSSIKVTFAPYGHLIPGTEAEAAALLDAFLDRPD